jgi:hypothetical protein
MSCRRLGVGGVLYFFLGIVFSSLAVGQTSGQDSLVLLQPQNVKAWAVMRSAKRFTTFITWGDILDTDSTGSFIHPPDLQTWSMGTDSTLLSIPTVTGNYTGDIDLTVRFHVNPPGGEVGVSDSVYILCDIVSETYWTKLITIGNNYTPGEFIDVVFKRQGTSQLLDLGLKVSFSSGLVDVNGEFFVGCEDFEGFHIWRGIEPDGSDMEVIGEVSKEEAFRGSSAGGSVVDSLYFYGWIPALRENGVVFFPAAVSCLGTRLDLELEDNQFFWADCNCFNGFTYYYAVTTFDRGYSVSQGSQGLVKIESCQPESGRPWPCRHDLVPLSINVTPQNNLANVFAVPNPYRAGGSRFTVPEYRNYPDDNIRFVNVPAVCTLKIYTVAGDLVWEVDHNNPNSGNIEWDVRNSSEQEVSSGIYIYRVEDPNGNQVYGRLVIIR